MIHLCLSQNHLKKVDILKCCRQLLKNQNHQFISSRSLQHIQSSRCQINKSNSPIRLFERFISTNLKTKSKTNFGFLLLKRNLCQKPPEISENLTKVGKNLLRNKPRSKELQRLFSLAKDEKWYLFLAIGCLVVSSSVTLGVPYAIGKILDMIVKDNFPREKLHLFCLMLFGIFVAGSLANFGRIYLLNSASK